MGIAAVASNPSVAGQAPSYGLASDLASADFTNGEWPGFVQDTAELAKKAQLKELETRAQKTLHDSELSAAQRYQESGTDYESDASNFNKGLGWLKQMFDAPRRVLTDAVEGEDISTEDSDKQWKAYSKAGGLLSRDEFQSFDGRTQRYLATQAGEHADIKKAMSLEVAPWGPGGSLSLGEATTYSYRGLTTPFIMMGNDAANNPDGVPFNLGNVLGPSFWFSGSKWAQAWRESDDRSLGNAIIETQLRPYASEDTLDDWRKHNSLFQATSFGTELGVGFYADPMVFAGKGAGSVSRVARNKMPLKQDSDLYKTMAQIRQGEQVTTHNPIVRTVADWRAQRMMNSEQGVDEYLRTVSAAEATHLPMARNSVGGQAMMLARHWAVNREAGKLDEFLGSDQVKDAISAVAREKEFAAPDGIDLVRLSHQLGAGDPKAFAIVKKLKTMVPEDLEEVAGPGARTFIDAIEATKTRANALEQEIADLEKAADKGSRFHRWEIHAETQVKQQQLQETTDALRGYEGYGAWLDLAGVNAADKVVGRFDQVKAPAPKKQGWNGAEPSKNFGAKVRARFFMDNQFGKAHTVKELPRAAWIQKANTASMHDLDSGIMSLNRQAEQLEHLAGYSDPIALNDALARWVSAPSAYERYKVLHEFEDTHLVRAAAQKFGVDEDVIRAIYNKINDERNKSIRGVLSGDGSMYSAAPSLGDRAASGEGVKLLSRSEDGEYVDLEIMQSNGHRVTLKGVHTSALSEKQLPLDPTQTPNYYQPINHREFFIDLKHNEDLLQTLNKGRLAKTEAGAAELAELIGTTFNKWWKPLQLWRLGWPQRVLMDEGLRAAAVFGPMYWITGPGAEAASTAIFNIPSWVAKKAEQHRVKKGDVFGPGPAKRQTMREPDPFERDRQVREAVHVPETMWPKINPARAGKIMEHVNAYSTHIRKRQKITAWQREYSEMVNKALAETKPFDPARPGDASGFGAKIDAFLTKASRHGISEDMLRPGVDPQWAPFPESHPMRAIQNSVSRGERVVPRSGGQKYKTVAYDPATGAKLGKGFIVPFHGSTPLNTGAIRSSNQYVTADLFRWYEQNAEMLSREGMRIVITPDGDVHIGKWFDSTPKGRKRAEDFLQYAHQSHPDREHKLWNLQDPTNPTYVGDVNKPSPFMEALDRQFFSEPEVERIKGKAPIEGEPEVFHGTDYELPEDLRPRDDVLAVNGNMIGKGLYTTVSQHMAESYGSAKLYTIRGSKSGKKYKVFDLDSEFTEAQYDDFLNFIKERTLRRDGTPNRMQADALTREFESAWNRSRQQGLQYPWFTAKTPHGEASWANVYETVTESFKAEDLQRLMHEYLETKHNAGAITHRGGTSRGPNAEHQVYIWLKPEDLLVRPAWDKTGRYHPVEEWLSHPNGIENPVPENRVVRTGVRNPMYRRLEQIGRKIEASRTNGRIRIADPEVRKLVSDEQSLMHGLGLEYRENVGEAHAATPLLSDRYVVADPDRFNRNFDDAVAEDAARTTANIAGANLRWTQVLEEERIAAAFEDLDLTLDSPLSWVKRKITSRREFGGGWTTLQSADGKSFVVPNAFEGHDGEMTRALTSSNKTIDILSEGHGGALSLTRRQAAGHKTYHPPVLSDEVFKPGTKAHKQAVEYFQRWADMVNDQIGNSPIWSKMLKGWDDKAIIEWLDNTAEGAAVRREVMPEHRNAELWVNEHRLKLDYYLPSSKLQRLLSKGRIQPSDLRRNVHESEMPDIFGPDLEALDKGSRVGRALNNVASKIWNSLGTVPVDTLSRHPFAKANYDMKMRSLIAQTDSKWLDMETIERFKREAHDYAMQQVRKTLWDLTDETNFTDALRFIAPFWGAQQEAITKWMRIVSDRPETLARFFMGQRAAYANFAVVDKEGQPVDTAKREGGYLGLYQPEDRVILPLPGFMQKGPLATIGSIGVPIGSANTVLQGELPLFPGVGPLVTIPADKFLRTFSDTYGTTDDEALLYRWLFPIGRPKGGLTGVLEQLSPGYAKRAMTLGAGEDDPSKANAWFSIYREMALKNQREGKKPPTPEEVQRQFQWFQGLRIAAGLTMPVQTEFRPKNQYFLDQYHAYQKKYGQDAMDKFMDDFGEEMINYAISSSNSIVDIPPTKAGMEDWDQNKRLIAKFPEWGSAIISPDAYNDEFSYDAYRAQFDINLGPGDSRTLRNVSSPQARQDIADERVGWREFRKFSAALDAELSARGLASIQQTGAEDLVQLKRAFIADMSNKYPAWREAYDSQANDIYTRVHELEQFAFRKEFDNRPDMKGVRQYLAIRDAVTQELDAYGAVGGSRSLQSGENAALRQWFYQQVGTLIQENPAFGEFYVRWLDGDTLEQGGGGF